MVKSIQLRRDESESINNFIRFARLARENRLDFKKIRETKILLAEELKVES